MENSNWILARLVLPACPGHSGCEGQSQAHGDRVAQSRQREVLLNGIRERLLFWDSKKGPRTTEK